MELNAKIEAWLEEIELNIANLVEKYSCFTEMIRKIAEKYSQLISMIREPLGEAISVEVMFNDTHLQYLESIGVYDEVERDFQQLCLLCLKVPRYTPGSDHMIDAVQQLMRSEQSPVKVFFEEDEVAKAYHNDLASYLRAQLRLDALCSFSLKGFAQQALFRNKKPEERKALLRSVLPTLPDQSIMELTSPLSLP